MNKQFSFLGGLPRTGSTLLCSILAQNPDVCAEGDSVLADIMWTTCLCLLNENRNNWSNTVIGSCLQNRSFNFLKSIPYTYYKDINKPYILDKCRMWPSQNNMAIIKNYINENPRVIILLRPVEEAVSSFVKLRIDNKWPEDKIFIGLLEDNTGIIPNCIDSIIDAKTNNNGEYLFLTYNDIVFNTKETVDLIYKFFDWPAFDHQFTKIVKPFNQNDRAYDLINLHEVRKEIKKIDYKINLPSNVVERCKYFDSLINEE